MGQRPFRLLLVEDDLVGQERLAALLREESWDVEPAASAQAARSAIAANPPDLLLCAHRLVGTSGLDLIRQSRSRLPHLGCVLLVDVPEGLLDAEARRQGIVLLDRSAPPEQIRAVVAATLATLRRRQRWPRKRVAGQLSVTVDTTPVWLLNVSYGGLGFLVPSPAGPVPPTFAVRVPTSAASVAAELVWSKSLPATGACQCGAAVADDPRSEEIWRAFVDRV